MEVVADGESADGMKEDSKRVGWSVAVFQFVTGGWFYVFLSYLNRFVYGFCLNLEF
jgi:hypothetical protein